MISSSPVKRTSMILLVWSHLRDVPAKGAKVTGPYAGLKIA